MTAREFAISLLPVAGSARPALRWAVLGVALLAGVVLGAIDPWPGRPDGIMVLAFAPGIFFDAP